MNKNPLCLSLPSSLSFLIAANAAQAAIIHQDAAFSFSMGSGGDFRVEWDIDNDGTTDMRLQHYVDTSNQDLRSLFIQDFAGTGIGVSSYGTFTYQKYSNGPQGFVGGGTNLNGLATGYTVGTAAGFNTNTKVYIVKGYNLQGGLSEGQNYIGFRFLDDGYTGTTLYGWAEITIDTITNNSFQMTQWAFEDTGASIQVGAVPEPKTSAAALGALALGAAGIRRWRKTRKAA